MVGKTKWDILFSRMARFLSPLAVRVTGVRTGSVSISDPAIHVPLRKAMLLRADQLRQQRYSGQLSLEDYEFFIENLRSAFRSLISRYEEEPPANLEEG